MTGEIINPQTQQALEAKGIKVTRRPDESKPNGNHKEAKAMQTTKTGGFTLPTIQSTPEEQAANEGAFNTLMTQVPEFVALYATKAAALLQAGHSAEEMVKTAERFCDADVDVFPDAKNFVGDQKDRFMHTAGVHFLAAMLGQIVPDGALASVAERMNQFGLERNIIFASKEKLPIGALVNGTWIGATKEYENEVYDLNILMLLSEKARGAYFVSRADTKDGSAAFRNQATVKWVSEFRSVTKKDLTTTVIRRDKDGKPRQVPAATCYVWFPRQKGGTQDKKVRFVTHEGGALLCAFEDTRMSKDKDGNKVPYTGIFVSLVPPTREGPQVVDGKAMEYPNDGEGYEKVVYQTLSEALTSLASPVSDRGHRIAPWAIPLESLQDLDKFYLELPYFVPNQHEFGNLKDLYRRLSWAFKCAQKQEDAHEAYKTEKDNYNSKANVSFGDFFGEPAKAGMSYSFIKFPWRDSKGKKHFQVHFLASRAEAGGDITAVEYPEKHKALLTDPNEFKKIVRELGKIARRSAEKTATPETPSKPEEVPTEAVADAPKPKAKKGKAKAKKAATVHAHA
ncbi:MAG: hypothetical protein HYT93_00280 [Parcubacteria group bacterium]|nr:hypothetical protein [Parcubacteria group bacterium]